MATKYIYNLGRRKTAIASVRLFNGKGVSQINGKDIDQVYASPVQKRKLGQPFRVLDLDPSTYFYTAKTTGGGVNGQLEAIVLGLSRALASISQEFRTPLKRAGLLTRDPRMVERKKTGLHKARKREQYSKR